jgi:murein DD-endopeptidase MepM/ murein hydrolase activator NlpD
MIRIIRFVCIFLGSILLLAACSSGVTPATPLPSPTIVLPTATNTSSPTSAPTFISSQQGTSTPTPVPCDPLKADYCILKRIFYLQRPIAPPGTDTIDRGYAYGSTEGGTREPHHGVEFYNATGTPVLAAADGTVFYAGDDKTVRFGAWLNFYGNLVILRHQVDGAPESVRYTLYGHLSKINVSVGQIVYANEKIGEVGASGAAIGSHLHFELRSDPQGYGSTINPELWLVPHPGEGVLTMRFVDSQHAFVQIQANVQYYPDSKGTFTQAWQPEAYNPELDNDNWENAVLGDLPAGSYRITYLWAGVLHERWVEIQPGRLTLAEFVVK